MHLGFAGLCMHVVLVARSISAMTFIRLPCHPRSIRDELLFFASLLLRALELVPTSPG